MQLTSILSTNHIGLPTADPLSASDNTVSISALAHKIVTWWTQGKIQHPPLLKNMSRLPGQEATKAYEALSPALKIFFDRESLENINNILMDSRHPGRMKRGIGYSTGITPQELNTSIINSVRNISTVRLTAAGHNADRMFKNHIKGIYNKTGRRYFSERSMGIKAAIRELEGNARELNNLLEAQRSLNNLTLPTKNKLTAFHARLYTLYSFFEKNIDYFSNKGGNTLFISQMNDFRQNFLSWFYIYGGMVIGWSS